MISENQNIASRQIDLVIIGAGPAGLSTALHLIQQDPSWAQRMLVLERSAHPRHKLCGGGVTQLGLGYLRRLGLPDPLPIPHAAVRDARFHYAGRTVHVRGAPEFLVFHRQEFDHFLACSARERGVSICEGEKVQDITRDPQGVNVHTDRRTLRAMLVVGADGSRGVTRRILAGGKPKLRTARLLEVVQPAAESAPQFDQEYADFDFNCVSAGLQGYTWDFPARVGGAAHHNRGVYDSRVARGRPKASLGPILNGALQASGQDDQRMNVEGHPIHWFSPRSRIAGERLLLVGDAAGAEPLFGEGIAPALGYGHIAAGSIQRAFAKNDFRFRDYKWRLLFSRLGQYLMLRWWIAWWSYRLSHRRWFMHLMWTAGAGLAALKRR
jgi:flavin-dependent dehydrogenase